MIRIELTKKCNFNCAHCVNGCSKDEHMSLETLKKCISLVSECRPKNEPASFLYSGGEISCYPHLKEAVGLAAEKNFKVGLDTNGAHFEKNRIPSSAINLSDKELSELIEDKLSEVYEYGLFADGLITKSNKTEQISSSSRTFTSKCEKNGEKRENLVELTNYLLLAKECYVWSRDLNILMKNGEEVLEILRVGRDRFHAEERKKRGLSEHSIFSKAVFEKLKEVFEQIEIHSTHGDVTAYVGNAYNFSDFYRQNYGESIDKKRKRKNNFGSYKPKGETLEAVLKNLYISNWQLPEGRLEKNYLLNLVAICGDCLDKPSFAGFSVDGSLNRCTYQVIPPRTSIDGVLNPEYVKIERAFRENGGPMGVARIYGMRESDIYDVLMDKGPCGLCQTAVNYGKSKK